MSKASRLRNERAAKNRANKARKKRRAVQLVAQRLLYGTSLYEAARRTPRWIVGTPILPGIEIIEIYETDTSEDQEPMETCHSQAQAQGTEAGS